MVADAVRIPTLHWQLLQRLVVDKALPAAAIAHQQPVALVDLAGLGDAHLA